MGSRGIPQNLAERFKQALVNTRIIRDSKVDPEALAE
jgi:hypothetical protein